MTMINMIHGWLLWKPPLAGSNSFQHSKKSPIAGFDLLKTLTSWGPTKNIPFFIHAPTKTSMCIKTNQNRKISQFSKAVCLQNIFGRNVEFIYINSFSSACPANRSWLSHFCFCILLYRHIQNQFRAVSPLTRRLALSHLIWLQRGILMMIMMMMMLTTMIMMIGHISPSLTSEGAILGHLLPLYNSKNMTFCTFVWQSVTQSHYNFTCWLNYR